MTTDVMGAPVRHRIGRDGSFALRTLSGSVRLHGTDGDEVILKAASEHGEPPALVVRRFAGGMHVEPERRGKSCLGATFGVDLPDVHFDVELPRGTRVEINSVSADISGSELDGDQSYKLVSGDLELTGIGGRLDAKSVSGDMRLRADGPLEVDVVTTSGDLHVEGSRLEFLRMRSVSGNATVIGGLAAGPQHRVETVSGDLRLEPTGGLTLEASGPIVGLRSAIGGQTASRRGRRGLVVGNGGAQLRFRSMSGEVSVDEPTGRDVRQAASAVSADEPDPQADQRSSLDILRAVERGELDVDEAARLLSEDEDRA
ncbi:hypothetical protein BH24CHL6_BH24CHL6_10960 [soil metagenome]